MESLKHFEEQLAAWPNISLHLHRFGGKEFLFGSAEIGHMREGGILDIPFPRAVRNAVLAAGLAEQHHWVPNSGWITFRVRNAGDLSNAMWLMRLSYIRYAVKTAIDPRGMLEQESAEMKLSPEFKSLLERFVPNHSTMQPFSAA
jgi:luciferase-like monooxygenase